MPNTSAALSRACALVLLRLSVAAVAPADRLQYVGPTTEITDTVPGVNLVFSVSGHGYQSHQEGWARYPLFGTTLGTALENENSMGYSDAFLYDAGARALSGTLPASTAGDYLHRRWEVLSSTFHMDPAGSQRGATIQLFAALRGGDGHRRRHAFWLEHNSC